MQAVQAARMHKATTSDVAVNTSARASTSDVATATASSTMDAAVNTSTAAPPATATADSATDPSTAAKPSVIPSTSSAKDARAASPSLSINEPETTGTLHLAVLGSTLAHHTRSMLLLGARGSDDRWYSVAYCHYPSTSNASVLRATHKVDEDHLLPAWLVLGHEKNRPQYVVSSLDKLAVAVVTASELQASDRFAAGTTLRFPRVVELLMTPVRCRVRLGNAAR